jgi:integrase
MTRPRTKDKQLPQRVYEKDGAYRFLSPEKIRDPSDGKMKFWIRLASLDAPISDVYSAYGKLLGEKKLVTDSMPYLCEKFKAERLGKFGKETQGTYAHYLDVIANDFEEFSFNQVTTKDFADFLDINYSGKPNTAQKVTALAKRLFKFGISKIENGRRDNPIDQLDTYDHETSRREFLPTHGQIAAIRGAGMFSKPRSDNGKVHPTASGEMFACIIDMTYLLWARAIDIRMLKVSQIDNGMIRIQSSKTRNTSGQAVDIVITPQIQAVIDRSNEIKKRYGVKSEYLLPSQKGTPYVKSGLTSMWGRARERAAIDDPLVMQVQFRDLRSLGATDARKAGEEKEEVRKRLTHTSVETTEIYLKESVAELSAIDLKLPWKSL